MTQTHPFAQWLNTPNRAGFNREDHQTMIQDLLDKHAIDQADMDLLIQAHSDTQPGDRRNTGPVLQPEFCARSCTGP